MPLPTAPFFPSARPSLGRLLGSWAGFAFTPLWPMLRWIFSPYFPAGKLPEQSLSFGTMLQFQSQMSHLSPSVLLGHILPQLLLCLGVCVAFSSAFGWLGGEIEERVKKV